MNPGKVSVVIITKNEEGQIRDCLESVKWADEIVVVDDYSTDRTVEIVREYTDRIFQRKMDIEGRHRNWAYSQARNEWVLSLDADERVTPELGDEIGAVINNPGIFKGFAIPYRNYIGNYWIRYGGWYPSVKFRLFMKEKFRWEETEVHPAALLDGPTGRLTKDIIHYSYENFADFLGKSNRQTSLEALKWYKLSFSNPKKARYKMNLCHALWRTMDRFIRTYFVKKGYRDGFVGFMIALFASLYQIVSYAKYWELTKQNAEATHAEKAYA